MLDALGYDVGKVDTEFDDSTVAAVKSFQADHKLEQTGSIAGETTYEIMDALREKIDKDDPQIKKATELLSENADTEQEKKAE